MGIGEGENARDKSGDTVKWDYTYMILLNDPRKVSDLFTPPGLCATN